MGELEVALGSTIPPNTPHAISVSLPTWRDNIGYEEGEKRVIDNMVSGYPRFFIHLSIRKLATICAQKYAVGNEECMLFATQTIADRCRSFIHHRSNILGSPVNARLVHLLICPEDKQNNAKIDRSSIGGSCADLHIVLLPKEAFPIAKEFWQHSGLGISSRLAEKCISLLAESTTPAVHPPASPVASRYGAKGRYKQNLSAVPTQTPSPQASQFSSVLAKENLDPDHSVYLEERYGRNLPLSAGSFAKRALRSRVAGVLVSDNTNDSEQDLVVGPSSRGISEVVADDVYLFPSGMAAIWNAHNISLAVRPPAKSVCFGFPYTDTLKILQKWGPGCHFLGFGLDSDIDALEIILEAESIRDPTTPPILALFTEFPSNPLLRSANLPRLRALANKYDFLIVIDETIGNFVNVEVLPYADILVSSLSKIFSGAANVMGGSLILNPKGRRYADLKSYMNSNYEDVYFDEDAIYMERNSRDFQRRIRLIDSNTEEVCDFLRSKSVGISTSTPVVKEVFYPKYITRDNYELCRIKTVNAEDGKAGGFGGLFSVTFTSLAASQAFYDALSCYKGPSLGTNFTLACPFTILAHFAELNWAAQYGVEEGLVRISVGMEDKEVLLACFRTALEAAAAVVVAS